MQFNSGQKCLRIKRKLCHVRTNFSIHFTVLLTKKTYQRGGVYRLKWVFLFVLRILNVARIYLFVV